MHVFNEMYSAGKKNLYILWQKKTLHKKSLPVPGILLTPKALCHKGAYSHVISDCLAMLHSTAITLRALCWFAS